MTVQVQLIPHEYVNKIVCVHFTVHIFPRPLLHFHAVLSTASCVVEKSLPLLHPLSGVHLGTPCQGYTWVLGRSRARGKFKSRPVFINFCPLGSQIGLSKLCYFS